MKKYTTFDLDLSLLINEGKNYISTLPDSEGDEYRFNGHHWLGDPNVLSSTLPSLSSIFNEKNLSVHGVAHRTANLGAMHNHLAGANILIVPIQDYETASLYVFDVDPNAEMLEGHDYRDSDCTVREIVHFTQPIFIHSSTVYTIKTGDLIADFFEIYFKENTDSYFS